MAMAILTSRPNSHPFEDRKVFLTEPSKVGRSVAKSRPAPNNCIFDCKVLSRNHAIIWFENNKFFLQDTKSSNGTFVNNVRLSKGAEESEPKQLNSGDIIQFGVDVVENSKKVTHGCIIANIALYLPDGSEATRSTSARSNVYKVNENGIPTQDIWQLSQYLQDALYREQMLENRLTALQRLITSSHSILDENSQKFAQEDKLLSRLEMLENQVETLTRNLSEEDIKRKLLTLQEDRHNYEMRSKESLKRMLQEKLEAVQKLSEAEKSFNNAEDECLHYKTLYDQSQMEMRELNERHAQRLEEMQLLQEQVEKAERRHAAVDEQCCSMVDLINALQATKERQDFESSLREAKDKEEAFSSRAKSLEAECDFAKQQLVAMKAQLDKRKEGVQKANSPNKKQDPEEEEVNDKSLDVTVRQGFQLGDEPSLFEDIPVLCNNDHDQTNSDDPSTLQAQINKLESQVTEKENLIESLQEQLQGTQTLLDDSKQEVTALNDKLSRAHQEVEEDKTKINNLEEQIMEYHLQTVDQLSCTDGIDQQQDGQDTPTESKESTLCPARLQSLLDKIVEVNALVKERRKTLLQWTDSEEAKKLIVNDTLVNSNGEHQDENSEDCSTLNRGLDFIQKIKDNFTEIERLVDSEHQEGRSIKDELKNAQSYTKDFKQQILELQDKLLEEQEQTRQKEEYLASLKREINDLSRQRDLMQVEKNCERQASATAHNAAREMQKQAARSAESAGKNKVELSALTDENSLLKQKVQTLESELKKYRRENTRLSADYNKLQTSHRDLELQERSQHEKHTKQQANEVDVKLKTEESVKLQEEDLRKSIQQEQERANKLQSYLLSVLALVLAMVLAYSLDIISISPGGLFGRS